MNREKKDEEKRNAGSVGKKENITQETFSQKYQIVENEQSLERFPESESLIKNPDYPR